ncbi:MAG: tetratricopeptide repeat protein [Gammaproteobacteria bacterium]|nr:tetratricopeptide repeat protein [Gammaproteobacteria bacterium]
MSKHNQENQRVDEQYNADTINQYCTKPDGVRIPLHRPRRAAHFTGRKQELAKLIQDMQPGKAITLCGPGGIGKTALATEAIWALVPDNEPPQRFPDGILYHSFYGRPAADLALETIVYAFGEEPKPSPFEGAQRALAGKRALLFLDGTEEADDLPKILDAAGGCGIIVTSRKRRDAVADRQDVSPLETKEAVDLLRAWGGNQAADEDAAARICTLTGGLPLAVRLVGRYLNQSDEMAAEYLQWLESTPLAALAQGEHRHESVPLLLQRSLAQVSQSAREIAAVIGLLALSPFDPKAIEKALMPKKPLAGFMGAIKRLFTPPARQVPQLRTLLAELVGYGLLLRSGKRYEVSHALVHTYARECLHADIEVVKRLTAWYTAFAKTESAKGLEGYHRLDEERAHLLRLLDGCAERQEWKAVRHLVWAVDDYLDIQGHWMERRQTLETGIEAAKKSGSRYDEGVFLMKLATAYRGLGELEKSIALNEQALVFWQDVGNRKNEGGVWGNLGLAYNDLGQVKKAIEFYERALEIAKEIGARLAEGTHTGNLGLAYSNLGQVEKAIGFYERALEIDREVGYRQGEGIRLGNLGLAYSDLGQVEKAIGFYERALEIDREIGRRQGEGIRLGNLGLAYSDLGQVEKAIEFYERALEIDREIGYRQGEGIRLGNLGLAYRKLGQVKKAIGFYERALEIAREIGDRKGEAIRCWSLGLIYQKTDPARAVELMSVRVEFERELGHPNAEAHAKTVAEIKANVHELRSESPPTMKI